MFSGAIVSCEKRQVEKLEPMNQQEMDAMLEAMLFAAGEAVSVQKLAAVLEWEPVKMKEWMDGFMSRYNYRRGGLRVIRLEQSYQICTRSEHFEMIQKLLSPASAPELSRAALEVLSIVAYHQPVIKSVIEQVRGVDCSGVINKLLARDLIEEKGRHPSPGKPILYGTTQEFLRCFGLSSLEELPGADLLAGMEQITLEQMKQDV